MSLDIATAILKALNIYMRFYNHPHFQKVLNNLSPYQYRTQVA
ncbi:hypothetical protein [Cytobacillus horneckiae]